MKMQPCDSALIAAHGHDPETNTLRLKFKNGSQETHDYANFTAEHYVDMTGSGSIGKWFHANLRKNDKHPSRKVEV